MLRLTIEISGVRHSINAGLLTSHNVLFIRLFLFAAPRLESFLETDLLFLLLSRFLFFFLRMRIFNDLSGFRLFDLGRCLELFAYKV